VFVNLGVGEVPENKVLREEVFQDLNRALLKLAVRDLIDIAGIHRAVVAELEVGHVLLVRLLLGSHLRSVRLVAADQRHRRPPGAGEMVVGGRYDLACARVGRA